MYSAVKINGQPLYKAARKGQTVERTPRPITIYEITYLGSPAPGDYTIRVSCSKGTYIRVLAEDIGTALAHRAAWPAHQSWSSPQVYQLGEWHKYSLGFSFSVYCAAFGSSTQLRCQPCGGKQTVPSCRFTGVCRIPVCCALWCSWPSTSVLIQQAAALQLLADFLQHGMLGVIQVAADLAPGCAGMAAAAPGARGHTGSYGDWCARRVYRQCHRRGGPPA